MIPGKEGLRREEGGIKKLRSLSEKREREVLLKPERNPNGII